MNPHFWWRWQMLMTSAVLLLGVALLLLHDVTFSAFNWLFFGAADADGLFSPEAAHYIIFVYRVLGAVLVGWGVLFFAVFYRAFIKGERWAWCAAWASLLLWYLPDTYFSLTMGFPANAALNSGLLLLLGIPLAATYRHFWGQNR